MNSILAVLEKRLERFSGCVAVVWGLWFLMLIGGLFYIVRYGANIPFYDEWEMVGVLSEAKQVDLNWLWQPRNDHRIPFPRLIMVGLYKASGWDFRVGMYFNVVVLAGVAGLLICVASSIRGRLAYTDAFFPLVLMHWGHFENLLWSWQVSQVMPVAITACLCAAMAKSGTSLGRWPSLAAVLAVVALPLSGVPGLAYAPALAIWLIALGRHRWTVRPNERWWSVAIWVGAIVALLLVPLYFVGLQSTVQGGPAYTKVLSSMVAFLSYGLGPMVYALRPLSYIAVFALFLLSGATVLIALQSPKADARSKAWGMLFFAGGFTALALSVGVARPGDSFPPRYFLQAVPAWCWMYFVWERFAAPRAREAMTMALLVAAISASGLSYAEGRAYGIARIRNAALFEQDVRAGMPPSQLVASHQRSLLPYPENGGRYFHADLASLFETLKSKRIGVFEAMADEPVFSVVPLEDVAARVEPSGDDAGLPSMTWRLDSGAVVPGLRVSPQESSVHRPPVVAIYWRRSESEAFTLDRRCVHLWADREGGDAVWLYEPIYELRIVAEEPADLRDFPRLSLYLLDGPV